MSHRKVFVLGSSVMGLGGLVLASTSSTGCSTTITSVTTIPDEGGTSSGGGKKDGGGTSSGDPNDPNDPNNPNNPGGKDAAPPAPQCLSGSFTAQNFKPPATQQTICSPNQLDALTNACGSDPGDGQSNACSTARAQAANKTCAACIFGTAADAQAKAVILNLGAKPPASLNQAGCIDHATGIPGCGSGFINVSDCFDAYCAACKDPTEEDACTKSVAASQCKPYLIDTACLDGIKANQDKCLLSSQDDAGYKKLFRSMAVLFCAK